MNIFRYIKPEKNQSDMVPESMNLFIINTMQSRLIFSLTIHKHCSVIFINYNSRGLCDISWAPHLLESPL